jgi:hypothetical protein
MANHVINPIAAFDEVESYANLAAFPAIGEVGQIYITEDTNLAYRWNGASYTEVSRGVVLGETSATAYRGDRGATGYSHSLVVTGNPHALDAGDVAAITDKNYVSDAQLAKLVRTYEFVDDFDGKILDETNYWTVSKIGSGSVSTSMGSNADAIGTVLLNAVGGAGSNTLISRPVAAGIDYASLLPVFSCRSKCFVYATNQFWNVGITNDGAFISASNAGAVFRYDSAVGTNIYAVSSNGAAETITDTGVVADYNGFRNMRIVWESASSVKFYIDGVLVATHTTNVPSGTKKVNIFAGLQQTSTDVAKLKIDYIKLQSSVSRATE